MNIKDTHWADRRRGAVAMGFGSAFLIGIIVKTSSGGSNGPAIEMGFVTLCCFLCLALYYEMRRFYCKHWPKVS